MIWYLCNSTRHLYLILKLNSNGTMKLIQLIAELCDDEKRRLLLLLVVVVLMVLGWTEICGRSIYIFQWRFIKSTRNNMTIFFTHSEW